jgi:excisionase family DNA binding protein
MNHPMPDPEVLRDLVEFDADILTLEEASELLRIHCSAFRNMIMQHRIPSCASERIGRFRRDVILRWAGGL